MKQVFAVLGLVALSACSTAPQDQANSGTSVPTSGAGAYDGHWKGSWTGVSNVGNQSYGCQSYLGNIDLTVAAGQVSGNASGQYLGTISGTVAPDGQFTGKIGPYDMSGRFSGQRFSARFTTAKCQMGVSARPIAS